MQWTVRYAYSTPFNIDAGAVSSIYTTVGPAPATHITEQQTTFTIPAPGTSNKIITTFCRLNISDLVSDHGEVGDGDILWISLSRDGNAGPDNHTGTVRIVAQDHIFCSIVRWSIFTINLILQELHIIK